MNHLLLNKHSIDIINKFYLAQAQECFLLSSLAKSNYTLISKMAAYISYLYSIINEKLKDELVYEIIHQDYFHLSNVILIS